jgi:hypothetical protein
MRRILSVALRFSYCLHSILRWESVHYCRSICSTHCTIDSSTPTNPRIQQLFFLSIGYHCRSCSSSRINSLYSTCYLVHSSGLPRSIEVLRFIVNFSISFEIDSGSSTLLSSLNIQACSSCQAKHPVALIDILCNVNRL